MKIECPTCHAQYTVPDERGADSRVRTTCVKCGSELVIPGNSATEKGREERIGDKEPDNSADVTPGAGLRFTGYKGTRKGRQMFPSSIPSLPYPKYRDPLIIACVIIFLAGMIGGMHWVVRGPGVALERMVADFKDPVAYVTRLIMGTKRYDLVDSFIRQNEHHLPELGEGLAITSVKEQVGVLDGRKTAIIIATVQGSRSTGDVIFRLQKINDAWQIVQVHLDPPTGRQRRIYP